MERLLRALERRFGRFAIPHVAALLIAPKVAFFLWAWMQGRGDQEVAWRVLGKLLLVPQLVLEGEVWRLVTFILAPPTLNPLWFLIYAYLLFLYCSGLQARWGPFRLNVYIGVGWLAMVGSSFLAVQLDPGFFVPGGFFEVELTLMLGFATFYPDFIFRLFFILPVKAKWLAWLAIAMQAYLFVGIGSWDAPAGYAHRVVILGGLANYLLFFGPALWRRTHELKVASDRRKRFEEGMRRGYEERDRLAEQDQDREREEADR